MLTDTALKQLKPKEKTYKVADRDGMYVTVSPTGLITFRYDYRLNGRRETLTIGRYGASGLSLARAREKCIDAKREVGEGSSPAHGKQREKRRLKEAKSFGEFGERWLQEARMADSTRSMRRAIFERDILPPFRNRLLTEITSGDVRVLCGKVKDRGAPATAVHVRDIIKLVYGFAILHGEKVPNPAEEVGPASIATFVPKDRSLSPAEIRVMLKQIGYVPTLPTIRLGMKLFLLTMVRKSELQDATWDEVDFENAVWSIPKERMKRSKAHNVYLSQQVLDIMIALKTCAGNSRYLLPSRYDADAPMSRATFKLDIKNADERVVVKTRQAILESAEFQALWDRIKHKTTYRVHFDNEKLLVDCAKAIANGPPVSKARVRIRKADLSIGQGGVQAKEHDKDSGTIVTIEEGDIVLPDVLTDLQDRTQLTRKSLVRILTECGRLTDFKRNPQAFIEIAGEVINRTKRLAVVDGIKYQRIGDDQYYAQELFQQEELTGYLRNMLKDAQKSVFEHVIYDSGGVERTFAEQLEKNEAVKIYAKLPGWFKVPTPLGTYNPDWAVLVEVSGEERLYFVVETKGSLFVDDLRDNEAAKIACGEAHFKALAVGENPARFIKATKVDDVMGHC